MNRENHDAFRRSGLGLTARRIWELLNSEEEDLTPLQIASRLGIHQTTAERNLDKLRSSGLTSGRKVTVWRSVERNLDEVAQELGTLGARNRQQEQHNREREGYAYSQVTSRKDATRDD